MKNYKLDYNSLLYNLIQEMSDDCDNLVSDADDGEPYTVDEGKADVVENTNGFIMQLVQFKEDVEKLTYKKLSAKY